MVERRLDEMGMTKAEFGRRINTSRQNVNSLLNKPGLDSALLWRISLALDHDFFHAVSLALGIPQGALPDKSMEALRLTSQMQEVMGRLNMVLVGGG
jgi:hypothetical protein